MPYRVSVFAAFCRFSELPESWTGGFWRQLRRVGFALAQEEVESGADECNGEAGEEDGGGLVDPRMMKLGDGDDGSVRGVGDGGGVHRIRGIGSADSRIPQRWPDEQVVESIGPINRRRKVSRGTLLLKNRAAGLGWRQGEAIKR